MGQCLAFLRGKELNRPGTHWPAATGQPAVRMGRNGELRRGDRGCGPSSCCAGGVGPARWKGLVFPVLIPQGLEHQPRGQAAASPSLTGMLIWALSRGALWPSRSTSTLIMSEMPLSLRLSTKVSKG